MEPITGGRSVLSGGLTVSLLILPCCVMTVRSAASDSYSPATGRLCARCDPLAGRSQRCAASGAARYLTGMILALSRAIGETASLIAVGAAVFISFFAGGPNQPVYGDADSNLQLD